MSKFTRNLDKELIKKLQSDDLYKNKISYDIKSNKVFPAIRSGNMCFYHEGGRLFKYNENGVFEIHNKYFVLLDSTKEYINRKDVKNPALNENFIQAYDDIKNRIKNYSQGEAKEVSEIYKNYPYTDWENSETDTVVLDIEVRLDSKGSEEQKNSDKKGRIDLLLFNVEERSLKFVEAKEFSNPDIKSLNKPAVVDQLRRYNNSIKGKKSEIISAYSNYIKIVNEMFDLQLPEPEEVKNNCGLLIFEFDNDQKKGKLEGTYLKKLKCYDVTPYTRGEAKYINIDELWKGV